MVAGGERDDVVTRLAQLDAADGETLGQDALAVVGHGDGGVLGQVLRPDIHRVDVEHGEDVVGGGRRRIGWVLGLDRVVGLGHVGIVGLVGPGVGFGAERAGGLGELVVLVELLVERRHLGHAGGEDDGEDPEEPHAGR